MRVINVVGARPNFVKIAPLMEEMRKDARFQPVLVHTGQHYDFDMSGAFFDDLEIPKPDFFLGVGSGTHGEQTLAFLSLMMDSCFVMTDSGGVQEETTALGIPCLTLRENTERPVTVALGTNVIVGTDPHRIVTEAVRILEGGGRTARIPPLWDGRAAARIVEAIRER